MPRFKAHDGDPNFSTLDSKETLGFLELVSSQMEEIVDTEEVENLFHLMKHWNDGLKDLSEAISNSQHISKR